MGSYKWTNWVGIILSAFLHRASSINQQLRRLFRAELHDNGLDSAYRLGGYIPKKAMHK